MLRTPPPARDSRIDERRALDLLMQLLSIEGLSGREGRVARAIAARLRAAGVPARRIVHDGAARRLDGYEVGNLVVRLPGTRRGPGRLFSTHMDTVPLAAGARPVRRGKRIVPRGRTALGGDNRTGCACLMTMVETLIARKLDHPPLTLLFTVGEESGLNGAREARRSDLGPVALGFNVDGGEPAHFVVGAIGAHEWRIEVEGIPAHAGVHPEHGVSAAAITALALAELHRTGWFGRVTKGRRRGTSNVGRIEGGQATNEVTPAMKIRGESRSHDPRFLARITFAYRTAFERAARRVTNREGQAGRVRLEIGDGFPAFRIPRTSPVARHAARAARAVGLAPEMLVVDGGLDATCLNGLGVPTITFGAGQHKPHSYQEYVDIPEFLDGCRLAVALATL